MLNENYLMYIQHRDENVIAVDILLES